MNKVWIVQIADYSDYITQTWVDTVWDSEFKASDRVGELNAEFRVDEYCELEARFQEMEVYC